MFRFAVVLMSLGVALLAALIAGATQLVHVLGWVILVISLPLLVVSLMRLARQKR